MTRVIEGETTRGRNDSGRTGKWALPSHVVYNYVIDGALLYA